MTINRSTIEDIVIVAIIVSVGTAAFSLGRLSVREETREPLKVMGGDDSEIPQTTPLQ